MSRCQSRSLPAALFPTRLSARRSSGLPKVSHHTGRAIEGSKASFAATCRDSRPVALAAFRRSTWQRRRNWSRITMKGLKKRSTSDETAFEGRFITSVGKNEECEGSDAQLIAGTAWLFAREGMDRALDYLFIDEAGQMALADAVAVGASARNIVLLGDPQQLPHVTQNSHPEGSGVSVLEYLVGDAATV